MKCSHCGLENENDARFCASCGSALKRQESNSAAPKCPSCEAINPSGSTFCENCGTRVGNTLVPTGTAANSVVAVPQAKQPTSAAWWLMPLFLGWIGGLVGWLVIREKDVHKARRLFGFGIFITVVWVSLSIGLNALPSIMNGNIFDY